MYCMQFVVVKCHLGLSEQCVLYVLFGLLVICERELLRDRIVCHIRPGCPTAPRSTTRARLRPEVGSHLQSNRMLLCSPNHSVFYPLNYSRASSRKSKEAQLPASGGGVDVEFFMIGRHTGLAY